MRQTIKGSSFRRMMINAAAAIEINKQLLNDLNVFPVPDGDTGTNMSMTIGNGAKELEKLGDEATVEEVAKATVYFDNSSYNWENVYAYVYTEYDGENAGFPGLPMTKDEATGYYKMDLEGVFAQWGKIIFSENSGNAANRYPADLEPGLEIGGKDMIFGENASWTEYIPAVVEDPFDGKYFAISTSDS